MIKIITKQYESLKNTEAIYIPSRSVIKPLIADHERISYLNRISLFLILLQKRKENLHLNNVSYY